jgi:[ribosomal protein S5]-alanine N-acetyltransferase
VTEPIDAPAHVRIGARVYLRALADADVPQWAAWFNDADVTRSMNKGQFPNTEAQQRERLERLQRSTSDVQFGIATRDDHTLAGIIGIHRIDWTHRHGDISIVIGERGHRGKGLATEAIGLMIAHGFEKLNLHKLTAGMWASNPGSRRSFEKNGFVLEGTLRQSFWCEGRWVDEIRLGLLRDEWTGLLREGTR